ncbi:MAG: FAD-dependent oxidoreductase, partial [Chloroflexi bacterium]|nr:FAD-dependent oxidoreductase [Chloroflexota bacterium]
MTTVAVIGAGAGGMAAAYDLVKAGKQVTIFERDVTPG